MKIFVSFSVLLVHVVSVLSVYIKNVDLGQTKLEPLENIFSKHLPQYLEPLNLTTGELKLFAGHSFQLIKAKCPAVSQERLALISKYIAKLISKNNPVAGSSATFKDLITSISTCTDHQITEEERAKQEQSFFQFFFNPLRSFRNLFGFSDLPSSKDATTEKPAATLSSTQAPPDTLSLSDSGAEPVQVINLKDGDKMSSLSKDDDDNEDFAIPSSSVSPDFLVENKASDSADTPVIRIFYTTTGTGAGGPSENDSDSFAPWNPLGWLGGVFNAIRTFFSGMFGADDPSIPSSPVAVTPRSVGKVKREAVDLIKISDVPKEKIVEKLEVREPEKVEKATQPTITLKGKDAFMVLIDNLCRIYCDECMGQDQIRNFKAAAKELFQLILTDSTGIELAAKHFLEPDFLQSINDC